MRNLWNAEIARKLARACRLVQPPPWSRATGIKGGRHCSKFIAEGLGHHIVGRAILHLQNNERNSGSNLGGRDLMDYAM